MAATVDYLFADATTGCMSKTICIKGIAAAYIGCMSSFEKEPCRRC